MRAHRLIALVAVALLVLAPTALVAQEDGNGQRSDQTKVTGGGQVLASTAEPGPGDTLAFTAISTDDDSDAARGEFQAVETGDGGEDMLVYHGEVTCLEITGDNTARFGGHDRDDPSDAFTVDVTDNATPGDAEDDVIEFRDTEEPCDDEGSLVFSETALARGNATIHHDDA